MFAIVLQVSADVVSVLMEKSDTITLDLCTSLMPLLNTLLDSKMERYIMIICTLSILLA